MKTLHAKRELVIFLALFSVPASIFIFLGVCLWGEGEVGPAVFCFINFVIFILIGTCLGLWMYCTHWIRYGSGKVVIRRISKKYENGRTISWWKNNEDEFLVGDIEGYGLSREILGRFVEHHLCSARYNTECFFELKGGRKIGCEMICYFSKDMKEFFNYIFEETGLEFQPPETLELLNKALL